MSEGKKIAKTKELKTQKTKFEKLLSSNIVKDPAKKVAIEQQIKRIDNLIKEYLGEAILFPNRTPKLTSLQKEQTNQLSP